MAAGVSAAVIRSIRDQLKRDEGYKTTIYTDTLGHETIGVGHNLRVPLSYGAIENILSDDLLIAEEAVERLGFWTHSLSDARRGVLINMAFNLGGAGLGGFRRMLAAMQAEHWDTAAEEMLSSLWARQVGDRAERLAKQMREDIWI